MDYRKKLRHIMYRFAQGSKKVQKRNYILNKFNQYVGERWKDREFRALVADEPKIITSTKGYYILPKRDKSGREGSIALQVIRQSRAKAFAIHKRIARQLKAISDLTYEGCLFN